MKNRILIVAILFIFVASFSLSCKTNENSQNSNMEKTNENMEKSIEKQILTEDVHSFSNPKRKDRQTELAMNEIKDLGIATNIDVIA